MTHDAVQNDGGIHITHHRYGVVLAPTGSALDVEGVLNPAIARDRSGDLLMYPRMVAAGNVSRIGLARSTGTLDAPAFATPDVVVAPEADYELRTEHGGFGCEDPRVTYIAQLDVYVMAYTAFGPTGPRIAVAVSDDARQWTGWVCSLSTTRASTNYRIRTPRSSPNPCSRRTACCHSHCIIGRCSRKA